MVFALDWGALKCHACGYVDTGPKPLPDAHVQHRLDQPVPLAPLSDKALQVGCASCGATVLFEPPTSARTCLFCGAAILVQPIPADPLIVPDAILPAAINAIDAQTQVRKWLASRLFAPRALKRLTQPEALGGVYLPLWTYAADTDTSYTGESGFFGQGLSTDFDGDHYTKLNLDPSQASRQDWNIRWSPASGRIARHFDGLMVADTHAVPIARLKALGQWDLDALCAYQRAYLAGFRIQRYHRDEPGLGFETAKGMMAESIAQDVAREIGGGEQRITELRTEYRNVTFRQVLFPIWIGSYRFQQQVYHVVVHGRTGAVLGDRPYSPIKICVAVAIMVAVVFLLKLLARLLS
jgi:hypothetical protein